MTLATQMGGRTTLALRYDNTPKYHPTCRTYNNQHILNGWFLMMVVQIIHKIPATNKQQGKCGWETPTINTHTLPPKKQPTTVNQLCQLQLQDKHAQSTKHILKTQYTFCWNGSQQQLQQHIQWSWSTPWTFAARMQKLSFSKLFICPVGI